MDATTKQQRKRERVRAWKQANRDKVLAQKKRYREQHRAEIKESMDATTKHGRYHKTTKET